MLLKSYSVRDDKVDAFLQPFFVRQQGEAVRMFQNSCRDASHQFATNPEDFKLFYIGDYDDHSGVFIPLPNGPEHVCSAFQFIPGKETK